MANRLSGLSEIYALFGSLDDVSKVELGQRLAKIGSGLASAQRAAVPKRTGNLAGYLQVSEQVEKLRVRAGLTAIKRGTQKRGAGNWYGIIVEYGRRAGSKLVQRRRRVDGKLRLGMGRRKRAEDIASSYLVHWSPKEARPFVHIEQSVQPIIDANLEGFWESVLARLG